MRGRTLLVSVVYILLAAVAVVAIDLRIVLAPAALASIILFIGGILVFRRHSAALTLPWPAVTDEAESAGLVNIDGVELPFQGYEQELVVAIRSRHLGELLACCAVAGAALYIMFFSPVFREGGAGVQISAFRAELICAAGLAVLLANFRWFSERRFLQGSRFTIGTVLSAGSDSNRRWVTYQFFDAKRERRGGREHVWTVSYGNAVLVLFNPNNPDLNSAHCAFLFHEFKFGLIPSRQRQDLSKLTHT